MKLVCGVDEAGRGPLAGPVTAAAVILPEDFPRDILGDSKQLTPDKRESASKIIRCSAVSYCIGWCWPGEIDLLNIHVATLLAMQRAVEGLSVQPENVLVDGKFIPELAIPAEAIIKGDTFVPEIQAASILAKTVRDRWMVRYSWIEPDYLFEQHKGYPTKLHRQRCRTYGLSPIHRKSFHFD